jgi:hypothetical protein
MPPFVETIEEIGEMGQHLSIRKTQTNQTSSRTLGSVKDFRKLSSLPGEIVVS